MAVKDKKRGRPKAGSGSLSAEHILIVAKDIMCQEGKMPSIRKLALALNVDAMAIYHYFNNKNALLEAITVSLVEDIYQPRTDSPWKVELEALCISYLGLLNKYPGLLETLLTMTSLGPANVFSERFNQVTNVFQLSTRQADDALDLLADYLHGFAFALNCDTTGTTLSPLKIKGPLELYCSALEYQSSKRIENRE
ncbi:TetR/AcrR family transcriptional regulator [Vibrio sp. 10N.261.51.F12]|uniref:TetR/AcrR family transcriptional regulator n=1 Tax=Vibrio sp. 10N.261.51.F12 TaxID=3229679 RepID=UPI003553E1D1